MAGFGRLLISYPIFRLALFMAAGIFLFDTYLSDVSAGLVVAFIWLLSLIPVISLTFVSPRRPIPFYGLALSLSAFLFGGTLVLFQRERVAYDWSPAPCVYEGVVYTPLQEKKKTYAFEVDVRSLYRMQGDTLSSSPVHRRILLYLRKDSLSAHLSAGETIRFSSSISHPQSKHQSEGFDYAEYLLHKGISGTSFVERGKWEKLPLPANPSFRQRALAVRDRLSVRLGDMHLGPDEQAVLSALTIGDKSELTPRIKSVYTASGTSHILALSGMHVGIITLIFYALLYPLTRLPYGYICRSLLVVALLWGFAFITGLGPSVVRAVSMFTLYAVASLVTDDKYQSSNALTLTAFLMLIYRPFYLFDVGFQLSFAAVFSILLFYPIFRDLVILRNPAVRYVWNVMCLSVSAQFGTFPLILYHFGVFPTYFLMANIVVAPLAFGILFFSLSAFIFSTVPWLGACLSAVLNFLLLLLNRSMTWIHGLYGAQITSLHLNAFQLCLALLLILSLYLYAVRHTARRLQFCLLLFILILSSAFVR